MKKTLFIKASFFKKDYIFFEKRNELKSFGEKQILTLSKKIDTEGKSTVLFVNFTDSFLELRNIKSEVLDFESDIQSYLCAFAVFSDRFRKNQFKELSSPRIELKKIVKSESQHLIRLQVSDIQTISTNKLYDRFRVGNFEFLLADMENFVVAAKNAGINSLQQLVMRLNIHGSPLAVYRVENNEVTLDFFDCETGKKIPENLILIAAVANKLYQQNVEKHKYNMLKNIMKTQNGETIASYKVDKNGYLSVILHFLIEKQFEGRVEI